MSILGAELSRLVQSLDLQGRAFLLVASRSLNATLNSKHPQEASRWQSVRKAADVERWLSVGFQLLVPASLHNSHYPEAREL